MEYGQFSFTQETRGPLLLSPLVLVPDHSFEMKWILILIFDVWLGVFIW